MRRGAQSPGLQLGLRTKKSHGTEHLATTGTVDGCSIQPEILFVGTRQPVDATRVLSVWNFPTSMGAAGERPVFDVKARLRAPLMIFDRGNYLKSFPHGDASARELGFDIRVFPLLGELPKAIEPHLPVCLLCR